MGRTRGSASLPGLFFCQVIFLSIFGAGFLILFWEAELAEAVDVAGGGFRILRFFPGGSAREHFDFRFQISDLISPAAQ